MSRGAILSLLVLSAVVASGCATGVPEAIRTAPTASVSVVEAQSEAPRFLGRLVRWGGTILAVHNRAGATEVEVLARALSQSGEPRVNSDGQGRFVAEVSQFLDPAEYPQGARITVSGRLLRIETRPVGDYPYQYPVVAAESWHLWPKEPERIYLPAYPYPHPWYDPWYFGPYRPWRYYPW